MYVRIKVRHKAISRMRFILAFLGGVVYSICSVYVFHDYSIWKTGCVITAWGFGSYLALNDHLLYKLKEPDPSWTLSLILGLFFFICAFLAFFSAKLLLPAIDFLSLSISLTYIGAKLGCYYQGCCKARYFNRWLNPAVFNTMNWLALLEIIATCVFLGLLFFLNNNGSIFLCFIITHSLIRISAYRFRMNKKGWQLLKVKGVYLLLLLIIIFSFFLSIY